MHNHFLWINAADRLFHSSFVYDQSIHWNTNHNYVLLTCLRFPLSIISKSCKKKRQRNQLGNDRDFWSGKIVMLWHFYRVYLRCIFSMAIIHVCNLVENVLVMQIYRMLKSYCYFCQLWILQSIWQKCWYVDMCHIFFPFFQFYNKLKFYFNLT